MRYNIKFYVVLTEYEVEAKNAKEAEEKGQALFDQDANKPTKTSQLFSVVTRIGE